jgi:hypothetical protein
MVALKWIRNIDMHTQEVEERVAAMTVAIKALNNKAAASPVNRAAIDTLCDEIAGASGDLMNDINGGAERFGVNFKETSHV